MKRVDLQLPYERGTDPENPARELLTLAGVAWPQKCACCLEEGDVGTHALEHKVEVPGEKEALIRWQVPYCADCREHARNAARLPVPALVFGFVLYVVVGYILFMNDFVQENVAGYGIAFFLLLVVTLVSYGLYRLVRKQVADNKMKETCSHHAWTVTVPRHMLLEGNKIEVMFVFDSDVYGEEFAALNLEEPEEEVEALSASS